MPTSSLPDPDQIRQAVANARDALLDRAGEEYLDQFIRWSDKLVDAIAASLRGTHVDVAWSAAEGSLIGVVTLPAPMKLMHLALDLETPLPAGAAIAVGTRQQPRKFLDSAGGSPFPVTASARVLDDPGAPLSAGTEIVVQLLGAPESGAGRVQLALVHQSTED